MIKMSYRYFNNFLTIRWADMRLLSSSFNNVTVAEKKGKRIRWEIKNSSQIWSRKSLWSHSPTPIRVCRSSATNSSGRADSNEHRLIPLRCCASAHLRPFTSQVTSCFNSRSRYDNSWLLFMSIWRKWIVIIYNSISISSHKYHRTSIRSICWME